MTSNPISRVACVWEPVTHWRVCNAKSNLICRDENLTQVPPDFNARLAVFFSNTFPFLTHTYTLVCPQSPSLPGLKDQRERRGYMQPCQPLENKHLNGQMKKKKKKKVLCHDSPYLSNDLVYTMSEIRYACIGSCRHRYMNMKSESLSTGKQTRASYFLGAS